MRKRLLSFLFIVPFLFACSPKKDSRNIELSEHSIVLEPGQTHKFELKNAEGTVIWGSSIEGIVNIDAETQTITALKEGRTKVNVMIKPNYSDSCNVAVRCDSLAPNYALEVATIAHKGYHVEEIENSKEAFIAAGRRNFYGIETDIYQTLDGHWVCNHDTKIKGMSKQISECRLDEIMEVNLSDNPNKVVRVSTFEEYINICSAYNKHPVIEFKMTTNRQVLEESVIPTLKLYGVLDGVIFISKISDVLGLLYNIKQENSYGYDLQLLTTGNAWMNVPDILNVSSEYTAVTAAMVEDCKFVGQYVAAWTVNDLAIAESLIQMGVKYITTDLFECAEKFIDKTLFD